MHYVYLILEQILEAKNDLKTMNEFISFKSIINDNSSNIEDDISSRKKYLYNKSY